MKVLYLLLIQCTILVSCSSVRYDVRVDSYGNEDYSKAKYYLFIPSDSSILDYSLEYQEYTNYLIKAFIPLNYHFTDDPSIADVVIFINYGISDPIAYERLVSKPVWGQTGVISTTSTGSAYVNPYNNNITYTQKTTNTPSYGITGYRTYTKTETYYFRFLQLVAFDLNYYKTSQKQKMIWQTDVTSAGWSDDLRKIFPVLVAASKDYYGKNSGEKVLISLQENDKRIIDVKGIK